MGFFSIFSKAAKNKSGKATRTSSSMGNKYVTEARKTKTGFSSSTKPKRTSGRGR